MLNLILFAVGGAISGMLINYLSDVLPRTRRFSRPVCPNCNAAFSLRSYLFSFKCPNCDSKPSIRSFIVLTSAIIAAILVGMFPLQGIDSFWLSLPIFIFLGVILVIDIEHHVVLIQTSIAGLILFAIYGLFIQGWLITLVGGAAGFLIMLAIYYFGILFTRGMAKARKEESSEPGMGFGDVYVCAFLGLFTGWPYVIGMIILAIIASGVYSFLFLIIKALKKEYQAYSTIPYAPFLILGAIAIYYLPPIPSAL